MDNNNSVKKGRGGAKRSLTPEQSSQLGELRVCPVCSVEKEISRNTFAPSNAQGTNPWGHPKSLRGWSTACLSCRGKHAVGRSVHVRQHKAAERKKQDAHYKVEKLNYTLGRDGLPPDALEKLYSNVRADRVDAAGILDRLIKELYEKGEPEKSFEVFSAALVPLIKDHKPLGSIHHGADGGDAIIPALMSEHPRTLILASRNSAKSTLTTLYLTWRLFLDPTLSILMVSKSAALAKRNLRTVRTYIDRCQLLEPLRPTDDEIDAAEGFEVPGSRELLSGARSFSSLGRTGQITGMRADLVVSDDIEGRDDNTPEKADALNEMIGELEHVLNPNGRVIWLGTPQSQYTVYARLLKDETVHSVKACMFEQDFIGGAGKGQGVEVLLHSRWPYRFSDEDLAKKRKSVTKREWNLHWALEIDTKLMDDRPLKIAGFVVADLDPRATQAALSYSPGGEVLHDLNRWSAAPGDHWTAAAEVSKDQRPYILTLAAIDPASGLAGRDAIGLAIISVTQGGQAVVRHVEGVRGESQLQCIKDIAATLQKFGVQRMAVEEKADSLFGASLATALQQRQWPITLEQIKAGTQSKGERIVSTLSPALSAGRLVLPRALVNTDHVGEMVQQMMGVTWDNKIRSKHDDIIDALSHAVSLVKDTVMSDASGMKAAARQMDYEKLRDLPIRKGGVPEGGYVDQIYEMNEEEVRLEEGLASMLQLQEDDRKFGRPFDDRLARKIAKRQQTLEELRSHPIGWH